MAIATEQIIDAIQQELKSFRSKLFQIDADEESSKDELRDILDEYRGDNFEPFAEEYVISRCDIAFVSRDGFFQHILLHYRL